MRCVGIWKLYNHDGQHLLVCTLLYVFIFFPFSLFLQVTLPNRHLAAARLDLLVNFFSSYCKYKAYSKSRHFRGVPVAKIRIYDCGMRKLNADIFPVAYHLDMACAYCATKLCI